MKPESLLRLYPRAWRERYGEEFVALLDHTGIGLRQFADVVMAASRERIRVASRGVLSPAVSHQAARFVGFYASAWLSIWLLEALLPLRAVFPPVSVFSASDHRRVLMTFFVSAVASRVIDNWALPNADRVQPAPSTARAIGVLSTAVAALACALAGTVISIAPPLTLSVIFPGQWFGRRRGALAATRERGTGRAPRPTSLITLGLGQ